MSQVTVKYDDAIVRRFAFITVVWGLVVMLAGLWLALGTGVMAGTAWLTKSLIF